MLDAGRSYRNSIEHAESPAPSLVPIARMSNRPQQTRADWRQLYPFESHWLELPGGRMHYLDEGPADRAAGIAPNAAVRPRQSDLVVSLAALIDALRGRLSLRGRRSPRLRAERQAAAIADAWTITSTTCARSSRQLDLERVTLVAQDWGGAIGLGRDAADAGAARADRAVQHGRVSAAVHSVANSRVPHCRCWAAGGAGRQSCSAGPRCG